MNMVFIDKAFKVEYFGKMDDRDRFERNALAQQLVDRAERRFRITLAKLEDYPCPSRIGALRVGLNFLDVCVEPLVRTNHPYASEGILRVKALLSETKAKIREIPESTTFTPQVLSELIILCERREGRLAMMAKPASVPKCR